MNRKIETAVHKIGLSAQGNDFAYWQTQPNENDWKRWKKSATNASGWFSHHKGMSTMFNQDFKEFFESLNSNHGRFLVIEEFAVAGLQVSQLLNYDKKREAWLLST